jgi:amino acid transporter
VTAESAPAYSIIVTKYTILGFGLYFYLKNKVGPLFWAIVAGISVVLGWLAHFSPFTVQTPQFIYRAYEAPAMGTLAVSTLALLMLTLIATTTFAQYLWARALK